MSPSLHEAELIAHITGNRQPSECACGECRQACRRTPCLGTPHDMLTLIKAGHAQSLRRTSWEAMDGVPAIDMLQIDRGDGHAWEDGPCPFFVDGRCSIHAIKPTEGALMSHEPSPMLSSPTLAVAMTWLLPENRPLVALLMLGGREG